MTPGMIWVATIAASVALTGACVAVRRRWFGYPPLGISIALLLVVGATAAPLVVSAAQNQGHGQVHDSMGAMMALCAALLIMFPPIAIAGSLLAASLGGLLTHSLVDSSLITPQPSDYGKARARIAREDVTGALREYRNYFYENPKVPAPLFASAHLLERYDRHDEAVKYYQEIIRTFEKQRNVWAEASLALAAMYENHFDDTDTADYLLGQVLRRARDLEQGRIAGTRVARRLHQ